MAFVGFTGHDGEDVYVRASSVQMVRRHCCAKHQESEGSDLLLGLAHYVAVRDDVHAVVRALESAS